MEKIFNYIDALNQYSQSHKLPPYNNVESMEGKSHSPTFTMSCTFNGTTYYGSDLTKEQAKNIAAKLAVNDLNIEDNEEVYKMIDITLYNEPHNKDVWKAVWNNGEDKFLLNISFKKNDKQAFKTFLLKVMEELT